MRQVCPTGALFDKSKVGSIHPKYPDFLPYLNMMREATMSKTQTGNGVAGRLLGMPHVFSRHGRAAARACASQFDLVYSPLVDFKIFRSRSMWRWSKARSAASTTNTRSSTFASTQHADRHGRLRRDRQCAGDAQSLRPAAHSRACLPRERHPPSSRLRAVSCPRCSKWCARFTNSSRSTFSCPDARPRPTPSSRVLTDCWPAPYRTSPALTRFGA